MLSRSCICAVGFKHVQAFCILPLLQLQEVHPIFEGGLWMRRGARMQQLQHCRKYCFGYARVAPTLFTADSIGGQKFDDSVASRLASLF